ncbi:MAG: hypothetical protein WBE72_24995 [Terracidiphilus sp.]
MQGSSIQIHGPSGQAASTPNPRLVRAAQEFEAQMMKELLKPMTAGDALTGEDGDADAEMGSGAGSGGALADFASESLGQALSQRGGFGIADKIVRELSHTRTGPAPGIGSGNGSGKVTQKVTGSVHGNTVLRTGK